ncbi:hypothetical protein H9636_09440 [Ureibacillus sp. Re31]|uniref:Lipoprotein n=1 Tax=Ureibacillus galli TaxID=2762222 RepID=A0ABR8XCC3_9BACL|nr:hypothetical protein [Ureibacillus galli]MBD8026882.1 hypothetical protein [Ureibacillus galli]
MKRMLMILLMISLMIGIGGCIGNGKEESVSKEEAVEALKNKALDYLSKYDDDFELVSFQSASLMAQYNDLVVYSSKYDANFNVHIKDGEKDEEMEFTDDYFTLDLVEPGSEYMNEIVREYLPNANTKIKLLTQSIKEYKDGIEDFEDYYNSKYFLIKLYVFDSTLSFENKSKINSVLERLKSKPIMVEFVQIKEQAKVEDFVKNHTLNEILESELPIKSLEFTISKNGEIKGTIK